MKYINYIILLLILISTVSAGKVNYTMRLSCTSNSMEPTISCRDDLIVNTVSLSEGLTVGSVYCYRPDYRYYRLPVYWKVCHRLTSEINGSLIFKGYNNNYYDKPVDRKFVALKVIRW